MRTSVDKMVPGKLYEIHLQNKYLVRAFSSTRGRVVKHLNEHPERAIGIGGLIFREYLKTYEIGPVDTKEKLKEFINSYD